jgi:hypothetical protein
MEEDVEGGKESHKEGGVLVVCDRAEVGNEVGRQEKGHGPPAPCGNGRPGSIRGQIKNGQRSGKMLPPESEISIDRAVVKRIHCVERCFDR